jgi:hypothetical protein
MIDRVNVSAIWLVFSDYQNPWKVGCDEWGESFLFTAMSRSEVEAMRSSGPRDL